MNGSRFRRHFLITIYVVRHEYLEVFWGLAKSKGLTEENKSPTFYHIR